MSILTKGERESLRVAAGDGYTFQPEDMEICLDTIDAMERTIKDIERATTMHQVETVLIAARAFGVIGEDGE